MLMRLNEFGAAYANRFPDDEPARQAFASIEEALSQLETFAVRRLAAKRQDAQARATAREALLDMMGAISRTARLLQAKDPEFPNTFLMPVQDSAQAVLTTARLFAQHVEPLAEKFREYALGTPFPENFTRLLHRYEEAIQGRERGKGLTAAARKSIEEAIVSGLYSAQRLDIIVERVLGSDRVAIADWQRNRRVGYPVAKKRQEEGSLVATGTSPVVTAPTRSDRSSTGPGTDVSDVFAALATTEPAAAETTVPVDSDVGNQADASLSIFSSATSEPVAETEAEEAA
jgi:hypothetical protein